MTKEHIEKKLELHKRTLALYKDKEMSNLKKTIAKLQKQLERGV